ncbi:hypothetical protein ABZ668_22065, partial [Streptomyces parvus]
MNETNLAGAGTGTGTTAVSTAADVTAEAPSAAAFDLKQMENFRDNEVHPVYTKAKKHKEDGEGE